MQTTNTRRLLSVAADAKTIKGSKKGFLTGVLYLAPHTISGYQVCPQASDGCRVACLYTAGRGVYNNVQSSRINKTQLFHEHRDEFMALLVKDIEALIRKAARENMIPVVRLNGTSDLPWEKLKVIRNGISYASMMEAFPDIQFYDYTKVLGRTKALSLPNYHLTFSLAEDNDKRAVKALEQGYNVAVVMHTHRRADPKPAMWSGYPVVNGDETDLRFLDPKSGHIVALFPKGKARKDSIGFVRQQNSGFNLHNS
ncbi:hypothetical protein Xoosp13_59 [Xanthomonas phage Xoo-sp13]|nr:hypothetical protein Xoosp13_59 [Xanthomonas phage Xoo-sp13]